MAKKKIDLSGVKEFLFNHGEKVALGVCAFLAIALGGWSLWAQPAPAMPTTANHGRLRSMK